MKRKSSLSVVLAVLVWAMAASTTNALQVPVDFSGRWVLESEPLPSEPTELVVRQTSGPGSIPRELRVTRNGPGGTSTATLHIGTIGGTVPGTGGGPRTSRQVRWENSTLVIDVETLRSQTGGRASSEQRREVWSVTSEGKLQIVVAARGPSRTPQPTTLIYRQVREGVARQLPRLDVVEGVSSDSPTVVRRMIQPPFVESSSCRADRIGPQTVRDALGPTARRIVVHAYDKQVWPTMTDVAAYVHRIVDGVPENGRLERTPAFSEAVILTITASAELGDGGRRPIEFANGYVHVMGEDGCEWWGRYRRA
jgi:hypothetical protein